MEAGAAEREELLRRQISVMPPERFEILIYELAKTDDPGVRRLTNPDGGADTILPHKDDRRAEVWQAKRYADGINWSECEKSFKAALRHWDPKVVTFAFARDFSEPLENAFQSRLVLPGRKAGVDVRAWTLSDIVGKLNRDEAHALKVRFFGKEQESVLDSVARAVEAGGRLETGTDLVERAKALAKFTDQSDPDFKYASSAGGIDMPAPNWTELPYLTLQIADEETRVEIASWPREGADVHAPTFSFTDDDEGRQAREEAVSALATGEPAVIDSGTTVRFSAPELVKEFVDGGPMEGGRITLLPGDPVPTEVSVQTADAEFSLTVGLRPVPAKSGCAAAFAGRAEGVLVDLNFELLEEPTIRAHFSVSGRFERDARTNVAIAERLIAVLEHTHLTLTGDLFASGSISGRFSDAGDQASQEMIDALRARLEVYRDLVVIEDHIGERIEIPPEIEVTDLNAVATAASIIRTGRGTATFHQTEGIAEDPSEIPDLPARFAEYGSVTRHVTYEIFGNEISLGDGEYELPPLKIVAVIARSDSPTAPARVVLEADGDDQIEFRLLPSS